MRAALLRSALGFLQLPDLGGDEANERLRVFHILGAAMLVAAIYGHLVPPPDPWYRYAATLALIASVWLARRGRFLFASVAMPTAMLGVVLDASAAGYGIHDVTLLGLPVALALAGLLLGTRGPLLFGAAGIAGATFLYGSEAAGRIRTPWSAEIVSSSLTVTLLMIGLNGIAISVLIWRLDRSLSRSRSHAAALGESEARWRSLVQDAPLTLLGVDHALQITFTNLDSEPASRLIGRGIEELFQGENRAVAADAVKKTLAEGAMASFEVEMGGSAPDAWWYQVHVGPIRVAGAIAGATLICIDVTERRRARQERETLIRELGARNEELQRFTYAVSHDLRSPLITIKGFTGGLLSAARTGDLKRAEQDGARVSAAADRMDRLLRELLDLSRVGRLPREHEQVAFGDLVAEAVEGVAGRLAERGVKLQVAANLPSVSCERARLVQLLQNLIENGVKFMGDQKRPRIEVGSRTDGNETVFFVRDNGIGVDARHGERIFGMFERLDPAVDGTGIGLALARRILETHNGRIWLESEGSGRGSTFCFTLGERPRSAAPV